jgi:hypothetical protein
VGQRQYLLVDGLNRSGFTKEAARDLRRRTSTWCAATDIYEYFLPQTGEAQPNPIHLRLVRRVVFCAGVQE